jgi:hypothetical protein
MFTIIRLVALYRYSIGLVNELEFGLCSINSTLYIHSIIGTVTVVVQNGVH